MKQKTTLFRNSFLLALLFMASCQLSAQTLIARYKFDNSLNDETTTYPLTSSGFSPLFTETGHDGIANGAVSGFAAADYLFSGSDIGVSGTASRTMTAWIKATAFPTAGALAAVLGAGNISANGKKWTFGLFNTVATGNTTVRIEVQGGSITASTTPLAINTWYHIAVVYDGSNNKAYLYLNGVPEANGTLGATVNTAASPLRVGNDFNQAVTQNRGFNGAIDDVQIYSGAASDAQILSIFNGGTLGTNKIAAFDAFEVYPSPVKDLLYFSTNDITAVEIYNTLGAKIASKTVTNNSVDMSSFSKSLYLVKCIDSKNQYIGTKKVVKE